MTGLAPNNTLYVHNLNDKVNREELKRNLYYACSQYGQIIDMVSLKDKKMRGQTFVVFKEVPQATAALRGLQGFPFFDKPLRLAYAKTKSLAVHQMEGTYLGDKKRKLEGDVAAAEAPGSAPKKARNQVEEEDTNSEMSVEDDSAVNQAAQKSETNGAKAEEEPPNSILFVQNLPDDASSEVVSQMFAQYPGFRESRLVPGKALAFVEFESDAQATGALEGLQGFKMGKNFLKISYARR